MRLRGTVRLTLSVKDLEDPCGSSTSGLEICHKMPRFLTHPTQRGEPMSAPTIKFDDGAVYERMMGKWSGLAGRAFIDWLSPRPICDGSTSVVAMARLHNCWSSTAPQ